jgi:hypothetical protein
LKGRKEDIPNEEEKGGSTEKIALKMEGWLRISSSDFKDIPSLMNKINEKMVNKSVETVNKKEDKDVYIDNIHGKG